MELSTKRNAWERQDVAARRAAVRRALSQLSPTDRTLVTLTAMNGVTYRAAAGILGMQMNEVCQRVASVKARLARAIPSYA